ncbi:purine-cytosine permease-like protein [Arthrobacter pigmenti]|uniref:Purine-cytosine permease-like protein n=1 Tax=Arthrobacter pigmenti TaxID=271432 RepID=A0A846RUH0_9MICC|nr:cytosine permease [Arthrobacter pigmenti]NJC24172.1 purine-cytosine permease-like protein [Arthrobacter pigmenti]
MNTAEAAKGATTHPGQPGEDRFGRIESAGIEYLPESERTSRPRNLFLVFFGGNFAFSVIVFGWLPITFGMDFIGAATACFVGIAVGTLLIAPLAILGPRTGTNNAVSSGAHFGIRGRLIGSGLTLLFALAYAAIAVWTSGDALVAGANRFFGTPLNDTMLAVGYAVIALEIILVALMGHGTVVAMQRFVAPIAGILLLIGIFAFAPGFDPSATQAGYLLGDFWPTWILTVVISAGGPLSYAPTLGDYSRRISRRKFSDRSVMIAACGGVFLGLYLSALFGAFTSVSLNALGGSYVADLVAGSPAWYVLPILIIALAGGLGQGVLNVYASGLDLEALIPRLKRVHTTLITSAAAIALLYLGVFVFNAVDSITAMTLILNCCAGPWVVINVLGFLVVRRGRYDPADLQVFNEGRRGGRYWNFGGWNLRAVIPWATGSVVGVLLVETELYSGPLAGLAGGVDLSLAASILAAAGLYLIAVRLWPEPSTPSESKQGGDVILSRHD